MKQVIKFKSFSQDYQAKACIVWCFDDRFTPLLTELINNLSGNIDLIKIAGGALGLTGRGGTKKGDDIDFIAGQVEKSIKFHETSLVVLMLHKDCRAYKVLGLPSKSEDETELLRDDLELAKSTLAEYLARKGYYPDIKMYIADFKGLWEI